MGGDGEGQRWEERRRDEGGARRERGMERVKGERRRDEGGARRERGMERVKGGGRREGGMKVVGGG